MSEKPHTVALGAFVLGALLIVITTVLFVIGSGLGGDRRTVVMVFDGSVKGLNVGAPIALRGLQVGQVTGIELILDSDNEQLIMLVEAEFNRENIRHKGNLSGDLTEELISRGLRAQLNSQSLLTGLLYVQLDFHPNTELELVDIESPYLQIPTIPTDLERITRKLQDIDFSRLADNVGSVVQSIDGVLGSENFQALPGSIRQTMDSLTALSTQMSAQLQVSMPKLDSVLDGANTTLTTANTELPQLSELVQKNLLLLDKGLAAFENTMSEIDGLVSYDSATVYSLNRALEELTLAGEALQQLARTIEEQPEALLRGKSGE
tara:strand:+ start:221696 stop:222658 length:963 start_codon:yes stop_codon:yes gene_type:complete